MKSLAEALGVPLPSEKSTTQELPTFDLSSKGAAKALARNIIASREYRESLMRRILLDDLSPQVELDLWNRAYGKTANKIEIKDTPDSVSSLSLDELEERNRTIRNRIAKLRAAMNERPAHDESTPTSVH